MDQLGIIFKKELKEFLTRKSRIFRFIVIDLFCFIFLFMPTLYGIDVIRYRSIVALVTMIFMNYTIIGFLAVDVIGMEKKQNTFETMLSTPLTVSTLLLGKCLFMFVIGMILFLFVAIGDSIILAMHNTSFFTIGNSHLDFLIIIGIIFVFTIFYITVSALLSIRFNNGKINRYIMLGVVGLMMTGLIKLIQINRTTVLWIAFLVVILLTSLTLLFIKSNLNKVALMKYFK